jgi:hypothetical protein
MPDLSGRVRSFAGGCGIFSLLLGKRERYLLVANVLLALLATGRS